MHRFFSIALFAAVGSGAAAAPTLEVIGPRRAVPAAAVPGQPPPVTPIEVVPALPFVDRDTTCESADALRPPCADLSSAPEVVYAYTPATDQRVDFLVSGGGGFDAALFVMSSDSVVACNSDGWGRDPRLDRIPLRGGTTYFIVVDGSEDSCGAFTIRMEETPPLCPLTCPPGSIPEGEVVCHATYVDTYDCGCNQSPPAFRDLPCGDDGVTVCGTYGTYAYFSEEWRDTDWYRFTLPETAIVSCRVTGQAETQLAVMRAVEGCDDRTMICDSALAAACGAVACDQTLDAGTYYVFVGPRHFVGVECGTAYVLQLDGLRCPPVGTQAVSWSRLRALYR